VSYSVDVLRFINQIHVSRWLSCVCSNASSSEKLRSSPQEAEAGGLRIEGQPCLHGEILSQLKGAASCGSHLLVPATWRMKGEDHESKASLGKGSSETPSQK
jgi:hypothetical protein